MLEDKITQTVSSEAGVLKVMRPHVGATVMGQGSGFYPLGCEIVHRFT